MTPHLLAVVEQYWHKNPGGTASATENTIASLVKFCGFDVTGVAAGHNEQDRADSARRRVPPGVNIEFHKLPRPLLYESWLRNGPGSIDKFSKPDSVCWASSMICPSTKLPLVATVHDLEFLRNQQFLTRRGRYFFPRAWKAARTRADMLVCPSQAVADDCVAAGANQDSVTVVPWGVQPQTISSEEISQVRQELDLPERFALWVGALEHRKNPQGAAKAAAKAGCELVVVGSQGHPDNTVPVEALAGRVRQLRWLEDKALSAVYSSATVLLYPSFAEGFGLPILESMAHGTPVITSRGGATEEVAGGAAVLIDPNDVPEIAEALRLCTSESQLRADLVERGMNRAGEMSWENTANGYADVFCKVA